MITNMANSFVIVNAYGRSNRGDSVLLDECIQEIRDHQPGAIIKGVVFQGVNDACNAHPSIAWSERIGNSRLQGIIGKIVTISILALTWIAAVTPWSGLSKLLPYCQQQTLNAIRGCDVVVSAPGGYIHDTNLAYFVALYHIYLGTLFGKPVILAPQSIGPIRGRFSRWLARWVLNKVTLICVRESYSHKFLTENLAITALKVVRAGDSAFWNDNVDQNPANAFANMGISPLDKIFGMTVVGWTFPHCPNPTKAYSDYLDAMARLAEYASTKHNLTPVIFNQVSDDLPTAFEVQRRAKCKIIVDVTSREPSELRATIAQSVVFLGTRFHSCIFALMAGRPTFAIAYLPKTTFIMNDLQLLSRATSIDALDVARIQEQIAWDLSHLREVESSIQTAVTTYRKRYLRFSTVLNSLIPRETL